MEWVLIYWLAHDPIPYYEKDVSYGSRQHCEKLADNQDYDKFLCALADAGPIATDVTSILSESAVINPCLIITCSETKGEKR